MHRSHPTSLDTVTAAPVDAACPSAAYPSAAYSPAAYPLRKPDRP